MAEPAGTSEATGDATSAVYGGKLWRRLSSPVWLLVVLQPVLFLPALTSQTFYFRDLHLLFFGQRQLWADQVASGVAPFWDPFHHGGFPFLADLNNTVLYPGTLLYLLLPPLDAFNLEIVLHLGLTALAMYALARALGFSRGAAAVAGLAFELSGVVLSLPNIVNRLLAIPYLPLALAFWVRYLQRKKAGSLVGVAVSLALMTLAGFPELVVVTGVLGTAWALAGAESWRGRRQAVGAWLLAGTLGMVLAAPQLIPGLELAAGSARVGASESAAVLQWSVHPGRLAELVVPGFLGDATTIRESDYWGLNLEGGRLPYLLSVYLGFPCLVLAAWGLTCGRRLPQLTRRLLVASAVAAAVALVLSFGEHLPGARGMCEALSSLAVFRYPVKLLIPVAFACCLAAAAGMDALGTVRLPRWTWVLLTPVAALCVLAAGGFARAAWFGRWHHALFGQPLSEYAAQALPARLAHAAFALAAILLVAAVASRMRPSLRVWLLACVIGVDLWPGGQRLNPTADRSLFDQTPPLAEVVRQLAGEGRVVRVPLPPPLVMTAPTNEDRWLASARRQALDQYTGAQFGLRMVFHTDYDGLLSRPLGILRETFEAGTSEVGVPILSSAGVRVLLTHERAQHACLELLTSVPSELSVPIHVFRNVCAPQSAWLPERCRSLLASEKVLEALSGPGFCPLSEVLLETPCPPIMAAGEAREVQLDSGAPHRIAHVVEAPAGGVVVFPTPFYRGWRAWVDGQPRPVLRANGAFQAVIVEAGRHHIERRYSPPGFGFGLLLAGVASFALCAIAAWRRLVQRRRPPSPGP